MMFAEHFHAFIGRDITSSFYNHSKLNFFDCWMKYKQKDDVTKTFKELCNEPLSISENQLDVLEKFILFVYFPKQTSYECINIERMNAFIASPHSNLRLIPCSRNGLREHIKRACLQSGWLWKEGEKDVVLQSPEEWGWAKKNDKFIPNWQSEEVTTTVENVSRTCSCTTTCKNCKCSKNNMKCLVFCRCQGKCHNNDNNSNVLFKDK